MIDQITKLLNPLRVRIANMVARAVVDIVDDSQKLQLVQLIVGDNETRDGIERFQEYGFTSVPKQDAEAVVLFVGGRRDHALCIATDDRRYRVQNLAEGEVALYDQNGTTITLKANGDVQINPHSGNVIVNGDVLADAGGGLHVSLKNHKHGGSTLTTTATVGTGPPGVINGDTTPPEAA